MFETKYGVITKHGMEYHCSCGNTDQAKIETISSGSYVHTDDVSRGHGTAALVGVKCSVCAAEYRFKLSE